MAPGPQARLEGLDANVRPVVTVCQADKILGVPEHVGSAATSDDGQGAAAGPAARAWGRDARPWFSSPLDHDRPSLLVEIRGENVRSLEGRTPTTSEPAARRQD